MLWAPGSANTFTQFATKAELEDEAATIIQQAWRSYLFAPNAGIEEQIDAVLLALSETSGEVTPKNVDPSCAREQLTVAESTGVDQLVANLRSDAAFVSDAFWPFPLRFNRFTVEPCRFVNSFRGCRAADACSFSHLRGAKQDDCLQEFRRHARRGISITLHDETKWDLSCAGGSRA